MTSLRALKAEHGQGLNVTRSLGDDDFKPWVMHLPEVSQGFVTSDVFAMLIASDGLWAHVNTDEVGPLLLKYGLKHGVRNLANLANKRGCYDNCSIVAVDVQKMIKDLDTKLT